MPGDFTCAYAGSQRHYLLTSSIAHDTGYIGEGLWARNATFCRYLKTIYKLAMLQVLNVYFALYNSID